jgi:hypothetical protein
MLDPSKQELLCDPIFQSGAGVLPVCNRCKDKLGVVTAIRILPFLSSASHVLGNLTRYELCKNCVAEDRSSVDTKQLGTGVIQLCE